MVSRPTDPLPVQLIAKKAFLYASRALAVGDIFDASEKDAKTLKHIGHADDAPRLRKTTTSRKDLTADPEQYAVSVDRPKRQYHRRDLVPEP